MSVGRVGFDSGEQNRHDGAPGREEMADLLQQTAAAGPDDAVGDGTTGRRVHQGPQ